MKMSVYAAQLASALVLFCGAGTLAACYSDTKDDLFKPEGASTPTSPNQATVGDADGGSATPADSGSAPTGDAAAPGAEGSDAGATPAVSTTPAVRPSAMLSELVAAGLDPKNLPALDALTQSQTRAVMKSFTKALGVPCSGCHDQDFSAPTANKNITTKMWDEYSRGLQLKTGDALYCDSCHQGKAQFLDRSTHEGLVAYMKDSFIGKLEGKDGSANTCKTCHGDPFNPSILDEWAKGN